MKVLLTGATGFVGSHILDKLRAQGIATSILLRESSSKDFLQTHLPHAEMRTGSFFDKDSLRKALAGITHVIHCAGCVKAQRSSTFFEVNELATRNLIDAANAFQGQVERFILMSSLAAAGPAIPSDPARENTPAAPVSEYGKSKLAGEKAVRDRCASDYVILRPPAVYGPRDREFLRLFRAVRKHILVQPGHQPLSVVFVKDLADAAVLCLTHPAARKGTYFVASPEVVSAHRIAQEIATQIGTWGLRLPLPTAVLWTICLFCEICSQLSGKASVLSLQKFAELRASGWVCDAGRLKEETGFECATDLKNGIAQTLIWYQKHGWIPT